MATPYVFFGGTCADAFTRYHEIFGGDLQLMRFSDNPEGDVPPGRDDQILHAALMAPNVSLLGSDDPTTDDPGDVNRMALAIDLETPADVQRVFEQLSEGGVVIEAPIETFFSPAFSVLVDRFGVQWMVMASPRQPPPQSPPPQ